MGRLKFAYPTSRGIACEMWDTRFSVDGALASSSAPATAWRLHGGVGATAPASRGCTLWACGPVGSVRRAAGGHSSVTHSRFTTLPHRALSIGIDRRRRHAVLGRLTGETVEVAQATARDSHSGGITAEYEVVVLTHARPRDGVRIDRNEGGRTSD